MTGHSRNNALDHVVVLMFENRSFDNLLGRLYQPGAVKSFEGVFGKRLSNPIPGWAEHGADRKTVPYQRSLPWRAGAWLAARFGSRTCRDGVYHDDCAELAWQQIGAMKRLFPRRLTERH
jgi:hypothetical protein